MVCYAMIHINNYGFETRRGGEKKKFTTINTRCDAQKEHS